MQSVVERELPLPANQCVGKGDGDPLHGALVDILHVTSDQVFD